MSADAPIVSRPFHPKMCCDACVWKRGEHAIWCLVMPQLPIPADTSEPVCATFAQTYFTSSDYGIQWDGDTYTISEIFRVANPGSEAIVHNLTIPKAPMNQVKRGKLIEE